MSVLRASPLLALRLACFTGRFPCRTPLWRRLPVVSLSSWSPSSHVPFPAAASSSAAAADTSPVSLSSSNSTERPFLDSRQAVEVLSSLEWVKRTALCGELGEGEVGQRVRLCGWVALHRIHGGLTFLNLRDHSGIVQITTIPDQYPDAYDVANKVRIEYVVAVEGTVRLRPNESVNKKMKTGTVEVVAEHVQVLNSVKSQLPFLVTTTEDAKENLTEEIRLRFSAL